MGAPMKSVIVLKNMYASPPYALHSDCNFRHTYCSQKPKAKSQKPKAKSQKPNVNRNAAIISRCKRIGTY
jgi:hypothetical protein